MTTSMEGQLDVYDFLYKQNEPALSLQASFDYACACEHEVPVLDPNSMKCR